MLVLIVLPMVLAPPVSAQDVATSFEQLRALVKPGDTVYVTDASGRRTKGKLGELSAASLELLVRQTQSDGSEKWVPKARLSEGEVRQITRERHDSLWNGALIGLAVGAARVDLYRYQCRWDPTHRTRCRVSDNHDTWCDGRGHRGVDRRVDFRAVDGVRDARSPVLARAGITAPVEIGGWRPDVRQILNLFSAARCTGYRRVPL